MKENFLSPEALYCSEEERDALIQTLALFESGKIAFYKDFPDHDYNWGSSPVLPAGTTEFVAFDLTTVGAKRKCGAVACGLGWARALVGDRFGQKIFPSGPRTGAQGALFAMSIIRSCVPKDLDPDEEMEQVFWMSVGQKAQVAASDVRPEQWAIALRTFLETGAPDWKKAFSQTPNKEPSHATTL